MFHLGIFFKKRPKENCEKAFEFSVLSVQPSFKTTSSEEKRLTRLVWLQCNPFSGPFAVTQVLSSHGRSGSQAQHWSCTTLDFHFSWSQRPPNTHKHTHPALQRFLGPSTEKPAGSAAPSMWLFLTSSETKPCPVVCSHISKQHQRHKRGVLKSSGCLQQLKREGGRGQITCMYITVLSQSVQLCPKI